MLKLVMYVKREGLIMDNFMDKLVEKINMQNSRTRRDQSDEEEIYKNTRTQIEEFKNSTHEDIENLRKEIGESKGTEETKALLNESTDKLLSEIRERKGPDLDEMKSSVSDIVHKEDVKLYRNVQAVVQDENNKTLEKLESLEKLDKLDEFEKVNGRLEDIESVEGVLAGRTSGLKGLLVGAVILLALNLAGVAVIIARLYGLI